MNKNLMVAVSAAYMLGMGIYVQQSLKRMRVEQEKLRSDFEFFRMTSRLEM